MDPQALTYHNLSSLFKVVITLPLPPPVEGGGFKTLSPGGRGEGEGGFLINIQPLS